MRVMAAGEGDITPPTVTDGSLNDRAARVFEFLVELQRLRTKVVRSLDALAYLGAHPRGPARISPAVDRSVLSGGGRTATLCAPGPSRLRTVGNEPGPGGGRAPSRSGPSTNCRITALCAEHG